MFEIQNLTGEKTRQLIDTEQVFEQWASSSQELSHRFSGSMTWKSISGNDYLYRKHSQVAKSLGPRSTETEIAYKQFRDGKEATKNRLAALSVRLNEMAAINRAMRIGRMPLLPARILRALSKRNSLGTHIIVAGTHALFAYERLAGVRIESGLLATGDIDLLRDSRNRLSLTGDATFGEGIIGLLQQVDKSFRLIAKGSFRAANDSGFLVDLITPAARQLLKPKAEMDPGDDLVAVEIEGLQWLVNSPKIKVTVLDERGFPLDCIVPDPRAFALHKLWLSERNDRDPLKRRRDREQAQLVAMLVKKHLPQLRFEQLDLTALPEKLRNRANEFRSDNVSSPETGQTEPDW